MVDGRRDAEPPSQDAGPGHGWFLAGVFVTTLVTLSLEILNTRLLSVLTWYHLSFFAVSTALFGMSAGAVHVYLGIDSGDEAAARRALARAALAFAVSIPIAHAVNLVVPLQSAISVTTVVALLVTTVALSVPFYGSGVVVAIALTRVRGPSGLTYGVDLIGAALGSLLVLPMLKAMDVTSATLLCGALALLGAACFRVFAGSGGERRLALVAVILVAAALLNASSLQGLRVAFTKGKPVRMAGVVAEYWTTHGHVKVRSPRESKPWYWGAGTGTEAYRVNTVAMAIDGVAATILTEWDGDPASLEWVSHDVTALPYHLRQGGTAAVIGVGGGRDLLTALWARSRSVTGVEVNEAFLDILSGRYRELAGLFGRDDVRLVHDEARSYLTRTTDRYDVLQMSLIDTFAATGAGAFTLSENGLYTREAWHQFLSVLAPGGLLSVSRWFSPTQASETSRLLVLATSVLLERGVSKPAAHMALLARRGVATLLLSNEPLPPRDLAKIRQVSRRFGFRLLLLPGAKPQNEELGRIAASRTPDDLDASIVDELYDYSVPTDQRPYYFNILRPGSVFANLERQGIGVIADGNLAATGTLLVLWGVSLLLVAVVIFAPLLRSGLPRLERRSFAAAVGYFACIGLGFMWVQVPLMQRFSVYLGHPSYAIAVILFSMILAAGIGSLLSDRISLSAPVRLAVAPPLAVALLLLLGTAVLQPLIDATIHLELLERCAIVVATVGLAALPMGTCLPLGLRVVQRLSDEAGPWMWGVNGACSVLAAVSAVGVSMWSGIHTNLQLAAAAYGLAALLVTFLWRRA